MADLSVISEPLPGVFVLDCPHFPDHRGDFTKLFHSDALLAQGIDFKPAESFLTRSNAGVLRGMHFQVGEAAHDKLVSCIKGKVLDVVVDVRPESNHFNKPLALELSESDNRTPNRQGLHPGSRLALKLDALFNNHCSLPIHGSGVL